MNTPNKSDQELEDRLASRFLDVLIRAGLILAMIMLPDHKTKEVAEKLDPAA